MIPLRITSIHWSPPTTAELVRQVFRVAVRGLIDLSAFSAFVVCRDLQGRNGTAPASFRCPPYG